METETTAPNLRELGEARLAVARTASTLEQWNELWQKPAHPFPFTWGDCWKHNIQYRVDDFSAEVGFYIDVLGMPVNAFGPDYAMFTSPDRAFFLSMTPAGEDAASTPPDAIRIEFMIEGIHATVEELQRRGVAFRQETKPYAEGSPLHTAVFTTPHGIEVILWGMAQAMPGGEANAN
jgi:hypothetical protein